LIQPRNISLTIYPCFQTTHTMKEEVYFQYENTATEFTGLISLFNQSELNTIPYEGSWTAAQVGIHVLQSNKSITQALNMDAQIADRAPDERVGELQSVFLNFNTKLKSPDFILPEPGNYKKEKLSRDILESIDDLKRCSKKVNLSGTIRHVAFGDITKLELLHFVVYHTRRHSHQLKKILELIKNR
jgi:hypothetical protein